LSPVSRHDVIRANLVRVRERIATAARRSGRVPEQIQLVAVTKYAPMEAVRALIDSGVTALGENRPQQLMTRAAELRTTSPVPIAWHLIGQLQRNKVRAVLPFAEKIHSVDTLSLLQRIGNVSAELGLAPKLLLQINVSGEGSKSGFSVDEIHRQWDQLIEVPHVQLSGLMTMAPLTEDENLIRSTFRGLRELRDQLQRRSPEIPLDDLSMGMSHDFPIAIEEGATLVRLGSVLFEGLA
jgi:pyridoxal phosphate enzyme (YggS family)